MKKFELTSEFITMFGKAVEETHGGSLFEKQYKISIELAKTSILRSEQDD